jgi:hypothetical protein
MGIFLTDEGHWQQTGAVIRFSPTDPKKTPIRQWRINTSYVFLAITSADAAAGIVN